MAVLGLRLCARALSSCGKRGPLFTTVRGPLTIMASLVAEHRLQTRRPSNCGSRAQLLRGMWDPPRPGPEPVSPAPAGRLPTTAPPGKPINSIFNSPQDISYCIFDLSKCVLFWSFDQQCDRARIVTFLNKGELLFSQCIFIDKSCMSQTIRI